MAPFVTDLFKGILAFFLLDMGLLVARQLRQVRDVGPFLIGFGLAAPLVGATLALALSVLLGFGVCDATLLAVLASSGSYIVVPAVLRYAIPEAGQVDTSPCLWLSHFRSISFSGLRPGRWCNFPGFERRIVDVRSHRGMVSENRSK